MKNNKKTLKDKIVSLYNFWLRMKLYKKILIVLYIAFLIFAIVFCINSTKYNLRAIKPDTNEMPEIKRTALNINQLSKNSNNEYIIAKKGTQSLLYDFKKDNVIYNVDGVDQLETIPYKQIAKSNDYYEDEYEEYYNYAKGNNEILFSTFSFDVKYSSAPDGISSRHYSLNATQKEYYKLIDNTGFIVNYIFKSDPNDGTLFPTSITKEERDYLINILSNYKGPYNFKYNSYKTNPVNIIERHYLPKNEKPTKNQLYFLTFPTTFVNQYKEDLRFVWYDLFGLTDDLLKQFNAGKRIVKYEFQIPIMYQLINNVFRTTVLTNEIKEDSIIVDGSYWLITKIMPNTNLLNYTMKETNTTILVPDGSGAIIENSSMPFWRGSVYENSKYLSNDDDTKNSPIVKIPSIGVSKKTQIKDQESQTGILMTVTKGTAQASLIVDFSTNARSYSEFDYRFHGNTAFVGETERIAFSELYNDTHFEIEYKVAKKDGTKNLTYFEFANMFKEQYLYNLPKLERIPDIAIEFLGSIIKRNHIIGIPQNKQYALTTFEEANKIKAQLKEFSNTSFYINWQKGCLDYSIPSHKVKPFSGLGSIKKLENTYLIQNLVKTKKAKFQNFTNNKNGMKTIKNALRDNYELDLITNSFAAIKDNRYYLLSPKYLEDVTNEFIRKNKYSHIAFSDIANTPILEMSNKNYSPYITEMIRKNSTNAFFGRNIALKDPYFGFIARNSIIYDVDPTSSEKEFFKSKVPFYETILSDYYKVFLTSSNVLNQFDDRYYLLYSLVSGTNIKYTLSYENTEITRKTKYSYYYSTYYENYKNIIQDNFNEMRNFYDKYGNEIINAEAIDNKVYKVSFKKGTAVTNLVFNLNGTIYTKLDKLVPEYSYIEV